MPEKNLQVSTCFIFILPSKYLILPVSDFIATSSGAKNTGVFQGESKIFGESILLIWLIDL